jgi:integrating conjugative element protein (TIGR03759 family)
MSMLKFHHRMLSFALILVATGGQVLAGVVESTTPSSPTESTHTSLTQSERAAATLWDLNESEWSRYRSLQRGIRSSISPENLSPIEILGIHARDASERRRYAERWARAMRADAERVLAFQYAYDQAFQRLFGDQPLVDVKRLAINSAPVPLFGKDDRLILVTRIDCPACDAVFDRVRGHIDRIDGVDIYFESASTDRKQIRRWAKERKIDTDWVRSRRMTLNEGAAKILRGVAIDAVAPQVYLRRNGEIQKLSYAEL